MRGRVASEAGGLYLEALVAVAILATALIPVYSLLGASPAAGDQAARQTVALGIARSRLEAIQALSPEGWDGLTGIGPAPDPAQPAYAVAVSVERDSQVELKRVTVEVSWQGHRGRPQSLSLATAVARRRW